MFKEITFWTYMKYLSNKMKTECFIDSANGIHTAEEVVCVYRRANSSQKIKKTEAHEIAKVLSNTSELEKLDK